MSQCRKSELFQTNDYAEAVAVVINTIGDSIEILRQDLNLGWQNLRREIEVLMRAYSAPSLAQVYENPKRQVAYLSAYSIRYAQALLKILAGLYYCGLLTYAPRVLDLGAGCGTGTIALSMLAVLMDRRLCNSYRYRNLSNIERRVGFDITSVDQSANAQTIRQAITGRLQYHLPRISLDTRDLLLCLDDPTSGVQLRDLGSFDLIILANLLNEIREERNRRDLLRSVALLLNEFGSIVIIEPGTNPRGKGVPYKQDCQSVCDEMGLNIYDPCIRDCRAAYCWTCTKLIDPVWPQSIAANLPHLITIPPIPYSHLVLRKDGRSRSIINQVGALSNRDAGLDAELLVSSRISIDEPQLYYTICDGLTNPVWLVLPENHAELAVGRIYHVMSKSHQFYKGSSWRLWINPKRDSLQLVDCCSPALDGGTHITDEEHGPLDIVSFRCCRDDALVCDGAGELSEYDLADATDSLSFRLR